MMTLGEVSAAGEPLEASAATGTAEGADGMNPRSGAETDTAAETGTAAGAKGKKPRS